MAAVFGDRIKDSLPALFGQASQLLRGELFEVFRAIDSIQKAHFDPLSHPAVCTPPQPTTSLPAKPYSCFDSSRLYPIRRESWLCSVFAIDNESRQSPQAIGPVSQRLQRSNRLLILFFRLGPA